MSVSLEEEGGIGILKVRKGTDQHTEMPQGAGQKGQILLTPVELVLSVKEESIRVLHEVVEEQEVTGVCMTRRSGPRVIWLLCRSLPKMIFGLKSNQKERLGLILCLKQLSV
jgi:hypothetical protein